ncbi:asparagine synthase-related protein [Desulfurivibrio sp. D14AmB]|uniref:asparagine synthase-related protein n=1 Tax=Desulfurivibrio sp. D14AmB TaxID=3374370 RepID=UPI00376F27F6
MMVATGEAAGFAALCRSLRGFRRVAVAFSGGVDSSLLLAAALEVHGDQVLALHGRSPLQAPGEYDKAMAVAAALGCRPLVLELDPYAWPEVTANSEQRCYHCKHRLYQFFLAQAATRDRVVLLDGTNLSDLGKERPGLVAIRELGVKTPLAQGGLTKGVVRALARWRGLANWDKPAASCLATRIMGRQPLTRDKIALVARGEAFLLEKKFPGSRFRHWGGLCRIEVRGDDFSRLTSAAIWLEIEDFCRGLGFERVEGGIRPPEG